MELRRPTLTDRAAVMDMMAEFIRDNAKHDGGFWPKDDFDYDHWLAYNFDQETGIGVAETFVPAIQLVSFDQAGRALGFLHLRLRLNQALLEKGGHIGYSIRPSERGKGYASKQLALGLKEAKAKNIKQVLVTCQTDNLASRAAILKNGGWLEDVRDGTERYWIEVGDE